jgi:hypothetical protein
MARICLKKKKEKKKKIATINYNQEGFFSDTEV